MTPRERLADAIETHGGRVSRRGASWSAACPAHEDASPSLSLGEGADGRALAHCHAGCRVEDVAAAVGLAMADLYPDAAHPDIEALETPPAVYDYRDAAGGLVFQVRRRVGKRFTQWRPDGNGGWFANLDGITSRPLYRLPELLASTGPVFVVEGEKDTERIAGLGLTATTNSGGAGKWRPEHTAALAGRVVYVVPDNDPQGRSHARQVAASLRDVAAEVKVVALPGLPVGGDVSSFLDLGGTVARLEALAAAAPPFEPGVTDYDDPGRDVVLVRASTIEPEWVEWLDEGRVPLRTVTLVTGLDGVGKSTIIYEMAAKVTRGTLPGRYFGEPGDVVIASAEDHPASVIIPRLAAAGADLERVHIVKVRRGDGLDGEISLPDDLDAVADATRRVAARLLIVDPLVAHMPLRIDSHKAQHVRSVLAPLARLAEESYLAVCAVVHFNGSPSTDVRTRISGSKALRDASRSVLVCGPDPGDDSRSVLVQDKNSYGPRSPVGWAYRIEPATVALNGATYDTSRVRWLGEVAITSRTLLGGALDPDERSERDLATEVIVEALAAGPVSWADLAKLIRAEGGSEITGRRARDELRRGGRIASEKLGLGPWRWRLVELAHPPTPPEGEQVPNPIRDKGFGPFGLELAQPLDGEQVQDSTPGIDATGEADLDGLRDRGFAGPGVDDADFLAMYDAEAATRADRIAVSASPRNRGWGEIFSSESL